MVSGTQTMIDVTTDIQSLTTFKRNTGGWMQRMRKTQRPLVLTVKGKAEAVVMAPAAFQKLVEYHDTIRGIRRGLSQAKRGLGRPVDEVFDELEREITRGRA